VSLSETQEIMQVLQEIMALLNNVEFKTTKINSDLPKTKQSLATFTQLERIALRYIALTRTMGLPSDTDKAMSKIAELIVLINMLNIAAGMLTRGPVGLILAIPSIAMTAMSLPNLLEGY
jgi:hypothetical protein